MIELKRGLNYIIGNKAYSPDELIRLLRKICLSLIFIALPAFFAAGFFVAKVFFTPTPFIYVPTNEAHSRPPFPQISESYVQKACSTYLLKDYQQKSDETSDRLTPTITALEGFAFSLKDVWCIAKIEAPVYLLGEGQTVNDEIVRFRLTESEALQLHQVSEQEFNTAVGQLRNL